MREITTKVYTFDELPEKTQDKIISRWECVADWYGSIYADAKRVGVSIQGFDLYRRTITIKCGFPCDTARLILEEHGEDCETYSLAKDFLAKIQPLIDKLAKIDDIVYRKGWRDCLSEYQDRLEDAVENLKKEFIHDLGEEYLSLLTQEYEYVNSREYLEEYFDANEYEFTEEGKLI